MLPLSRQGDSYKPRVKSSAAQRESEGVEIPLMAVQENAAGGRDPCFGRVGSGGKREGMSGHGSGPTPPVGRKPAAKVRQLQRRLWAAAKRHRGRRFHALYDRVHRRDVLWTVWNPVLPRRRVMQLSERPSVSRVWENHKHGLKGGLVSPTSETY